MNTIFVLLTAVSPENAVNLSKENSVKFEFEQGSKREACDVKNVRFGLLLLL